MSQSVMTARVIGPCVGAPIELWVYPGQGHAFLNYYWDERGVKPMDRMVEFLDKNMK